MLFKIVASRKAEDRFPRIMFKPIGLEVANKIKGRRGEEKM